MKSANKSPQKQMRMNMVHIGYMHEEKSRPILVRTHAQTTRKFSRARPLSPLHFAYGCHKNQRINERLKTMSRVGRILFA